MVLITQGLRLESRRRSIEEASSVCHMPILIPASDADCSQLRAVRLLPY
jgi:hypothetical protein